MAYAVPEDLVTRFGQAEMLRLSAPENQPLDIIDIERLNVALSDASALVDSFLRRRYATPLATVPSEIVRVTCILARFDLAHGDGREPSKQMLDAETAARKWLMDLRDGVALLQDATPAGQEAFGQVQDAGTPVYRDAGAASFGWPSPGDFWV